MRELEYLQHAHGIVADLIPIDRKRVVVDLLMSSALAWTCLYISSIAATTALTALFFGLSVLLMYRSQVFIHEVIHLKARFPQVETLYNWVIGYLNRFPSYIYYPHSAHHNYTTFAGPKDPEYRKMIDKSWQFVVLRPFALSLLLPIYQTVRFAIIPLFYPVMSSGIKNLIFQKASTLVFNPQYVRPIKNRNEISRMVREDLRCAAFFWLLLAAAYGGIVTWKFILFMIIANVIGSIVNMFRATLNHRYHNDDVHSSISSLMKDSITVKPRWWNELWAPLGLSYHCVHHLVAVVPYYNLKQAHHRLVNDPQLGSAYSECCEDSFISSLKHLLKESKPNYEQKIYS